MRLVLSIPGHLIYHVTTRVARAKCLISIASHLSYAKVCKGLRHACAIGLTQVVDLSCVQLWHTSSNECNV